jgi:Trk K+ transport system NAD-binding subunit
VPRNLHRRDFSGCVVCGDNKLALRLTEQLITYFGEAVTVVLPSRRDNCGPMISRLAGVQLVEAGTADEEALVAAGLRHARALALTTDDETVNIRTARVAQELNPDIRLVIRATSAKSGFQIQRLFHDCSVISDTAMAAPAFASAVFDSTVSRAPISIFDRPLQVIGEHEIRKEKVICAVSTADGEPLPRNPGRKGLVLATVDERARTSSRRERWRRALAGFAALFDVKLLMAVAVLVGMLGIGVVGFAAQGGYSWAGALYLTLLDALGAVDADQKAKPVIKAVQVMLSLVGVLLIPALTATVVDAVIRARLRPVQSKRVVLVGLGRLGAHVAVLLHNRGAGVVCIEKDEDAPGITRARRLGMTVLIGDGTDEDMLTDADAARSDAVLACTGDDDTNLRIGLCAKQAGAEHVPMVLRMFDADLPDRVHRAHGLSPLRTLSSSYIAVGAFASAMIQRRLVATIPVNRRVLFIYEFVVATDAPLAGRPAGTLDRPGEVRLIAVERHTEITWTPDRDRPLAPDDRLTVVATRTGLGGLVRLTSGERWTS